MEPVILSEFGEAILPAFTLTGKGGDETWLNTGEHLMCGGAVDFVPISATYMAVVCNTCGMRIPFPLGIGTYGGLRKYFEQKLGGK